MTPQTHTVPASPSFSSADAQRPSVSLPPVPFAPDASREPLRSMPIRGRDWQNTDPLLRRIYQGWR
jgi:hypothetical protein